MHIKCPNCGCAYDIKPEFLSKSAGNSRYGYGWWLKCYKCQHKWWLKNSEVEIAINEPVISNQRAKIEKISRIKRSGRKMATQNFKRRKKKEIILITFFIALIAVIYNKKEEFYEYLVAKNKKISNHMMNNINMKDVYYFLDKTDDGLKISVNGKIFNNELVTVKINGVQVFVYNATRVIKSWKYKLQYGYIFSGDCVVFSTSEILTEDLVDKKDIRVEVSVF